MLLLFVIFIEGLPCAVYEVPDMDADFQSL